MNNLPLIFSAIYSDDQFCTLDKYRNILADLIIELNDISVCNRKLLQVGLSQSVLDIKEVISYRNIKGYRWNSYVLRMAILKISYIIEVLLKEDKNKHLLLIADLDACLKDFNLILFDSYCLF